MISESAYWKTDLLRQSLLLRKRLAQKRWPDTSFAKCEQTIMMGFYTIRKLIEAKKLTDVLTGISFAVRLYSSKGKPVTLMNNHKVHELYDLNEPEKQKLSLIELCHQFIHSYIFMLVFDESGRLSAIWIASDHQRSKALFEIEVKTVIGIFEKVGHDEVGSTRATFDASIGDYRIENRPFVEPS